MYFSFGECKEVHPDSCPAFTCLYDGCKLLREKIELCGEKEYGNRLQEFIKVHWQYCAHLLPNRVYIFISVFTFKWFFAFWHVPSSGVTEYS